MPLLSKLDPWLYRNPFEGGSARRYSRSERCGFGDLDQRLERAMAGELRDADRFIDIGCGPATLATRVADQYPKLEVIGIEPSRDFTTAAGRNFELIHARAEALPLATNSVAVGMMLSSIRHVRDRGAALSELRRVIRPGGVCYVVELDPAASRLRWREHTRRLGSWWLRLTFPTLVMRTAPAAQSIADLAATAGFTDIQTHADSVQPVYIMRLAG